MFKTARALLAVITAISFLTPADAAIHHRRHAQRNSAQPYFSAKSALVWNITQNQILFSKNIDDKIYPASTTKVMTVLLALEKLPLNQYVTVSQRATEVPPTKLDLRPGDQYLVSDLIYACLLKSANDAAGVLAEAIGGTQENFVAMMNQKALSIGATSTRFINPHGLPGQGNQFTTARDMAVILKEALKNPFFAKAITIPYRVIYAKSGRRHFLKSHNKAFFLNWKQNVYGKTGYTLQAKSCFVGYVRKGNDILIVDVFGCRTRKRWEDLKWLIEKYGGVNL